jgi:hypothetical protein
MAKWNDPEATPWLSFMIEVWRFSCSSLEGNLQKKWKTEKVNLIYGN